MCAMGINADGGMAVISGTQECGQPLGAELGIREWEMYAGSSVTTCTGAFDAEALRGAGLMRCLWRCEV